MNRPSGVVPRQLLPVRLVRHRTLALGLTVAVAVGAGAIATYRSTVDGRQSQEQRATHARPDEPEALDHVASERRSHQFWESVAVNGVESEHYDDLATMAQAADAVVVGTMRDIALGRVVHDLESEAEGGAAAANSAVYFAYATIAVEENLGGRHPAVGKELRLQFLLGTPQLLPELRDKLPQERAIFFLRDMGRKAAARGAPEPLRSDLQGVYDFVSSQGLLRDFAGNVELPEMPRDPFLVRLRGARFSDIVEQVRTALQSRP